LLLVVKASLTSERMLIYRHLLGSPVSRIRLVAEDATLVQVCSPIVIHVIQVGWTSWATSTVISSVQTLAKVPLVVTAV